MSLSIVLIHHPRCSFGRSLPFMSLSIVLIHHPRRSFFIIIYSRFFIPFHLCIRHFSSSITSSLSPSSLLSVFCPLLFLSFRSSVLSFFYPLLPRLFCLPPSSSALFLNPLPPHQNYGSFCYFTSTQFVRCFDAGVVSHYECPLL